MSVNLQKSIVLVGMMGCGKSAVGSRLAMKLEVPFVDIDYEIEKNEGMPIAEIFKEKGEPHFRNLEKTTISDILSTRICVIATGGGAFINEETRALIKEKARSVYIQADFEVLLERVSRKNTRPLLEGGDKAAILRDLMEKRCPIYEKADIMVDSSSGAHNVVVDKIIEGLGI